MRNLKSSTSMPYTEFFSLSLPYYNLNLLWIHINQNNRNLHILHLVFVEDKFFTPHGFISLVTCTISTLSWIMEKSLLKPKRAYIHTKRFQSPWFKLTAHHLIFWLMFQVHESHWGNFGSHGLKGQEICSIKVQWFKVDKGKHVTWRVFPNSPNSDGSVCNR